MMSSALAVGLLRIDILVELVDEAEDVAVVLLQQLLQIVARRGPRRVVVGDSTAYESPVNLAVEIVSVGHQQEREVAFQLPPHLLGEEGHGIGLAAPLRVPEHPEPPKVGMCPLDNVDWPLGDVGRRLLRDHWPRRQVLRERTRFKWQFHDAMPQAPLRRELQLQFFLARHGRHRPIDAQYLVVSGNDLPRGARLALVEQDEVLDNVEQPIVRQHAVQQHLGFQAALVRLVEPLPLGKVLPLAGDRTVAGAVAVRDDQEGVVMEGMGDDVLVHVVGEVVVEALADVLVDRLQLDEDQRQAVDETDQVGAAVVVGRADSGQLQFAHGEEAVRARGIVEIDYSGAGGLPVSLGVSVFHGYATAEHAIEIAVVLHHRAADVIRGQVPYYVVNGYGRQVRVEPFQRRSEVTGQHRLLGVGTAEGAVGPESLFVPGVDAVPAEHSFEMFGEGRLHKPVFAVDGRHRHRIRPRVVVPDAPIRQ